MILAAVSCAGLTALIVSDFNRGRARILDLLKTLGKGTACGEHEETRSDAKAKIKTHGHLCMTRIRWNKSVLAVRFTTLENRQQSYYDKQEAEFLDAQ